MWKHRDKIPLGEKGEISYIQEELFELIDAEKQKINRIWPIIESSDVIRAVGKFTWKHHKIPFLFIVLLSYIRVPYKIIRNIILDIIGVQKHK